MVSCEISTNIGDNIVISNIGTITKNLYKFPILFFY